MDALHRETLYPCFVIFFTASRVDFTAGFQICSNINWHHDDVMTWICSPQKWPFESGQFMRLIMRTGSVMWTFGGYLSLDWTSCWTNSRVTGDLRRNVTNLPSVWWPWLWHPCWYTRFWRSDASRFRLSVHNIQTKWITLHLMIKPSFILHRYTRVYSVFAWTPFINLRWELLNMGVLVNIITVAPG